jgi:ferrous iron transport protein A
MADFDEDGIISKFVNKAQNTMLVLPEVKNMSKKLSELRPGQRAVIKEFGSQEIHLKLMEMGCLPGEEISVEQVAPLGDPLSVQVAGYTLSLRLDEAEHIIVDSIN